MVMPARAEVATQGEDTRARDLALVRKAQAGDQRAFAQLVERYQRKAFSVALGLLKDKEEAMDAAQEAFVKVYRYLDHFKGDASFYTWLYRIVVNLCFDRRRRASTKEQAEFEDAQALDQVPENHRAILLLREVDGLSYEDLSKTLKIPKGTVMSRLFHARKKVQKLLADYLGDDAPGEWLGDEG